HILIVNSEATPNSRPSSTNNCGPFLARYFGPRHIGKFCLAQICALEPTLMQVSISKGKHIKWLDDHVPKVNLCPGKNWQYLAAFVSVDQERSCQECGMGEVSTFSK